MSDTSREKTVLKSYFETGDKPTQSQFDDLISSLTGQFYFTQDLPGDNTLHLLGAISVPTGRVLAMEVGWLSISTGGDFIAAAKSDFRIQNNGVTMGLNPLGWFITLQAIQYVGGNVTANFTKPGSGSSMYWAWDGDNPGQYALGDIVLNDTAKQVEFWAGRKTGSPGTAQVSVRILHDFQMQLPSGSSGSS
jgi:hypothetical protein